MPGKTTPGVGYQNQRTTIKVGAVMYGTRNLDQAEFLTREGGRVIN